MNKALPAVGQIETIPRDVMMNAPVSDSPDRPAAWMSALWWLAGAAALVHLLSQYPSFYQPWILDELDGSAKQVLSAAFAESWQFGRDIVFIYGPWGFLEAAYNPQTHAAFLIVAIALAVVFAFASWQFARQLPGNGILPVVWLAGFTWVAGRMLQGEFHVMSCAGSLLLLVWHFFVRDRGFTTLEACLAAMLAVLSLIKFTHFMESVVVVSVIGLDSIFRQRRFPWTVLVYVAGVVLFWLVAGQHLSSLRLYLLGSLKLASGWTEAASTRGQRELQQVGWFALTAAVSCGWLGVVAWVRHRLFGLLPLAALGGLLFISFKYGYVRASDHVPAAVMAMLVFSFLCSAVAWLGWRPQDWKRGLACFAPAITALALALTTAGRNPELDGLLTPARHPGESLLSRLVRTVEGQAPWNALQLFRQAELQRAYERYAGENRRLYPIPKMDGSVDVYPAYQKVVFAHGLPYRPRPVIQSNLTTTPELAARNAAHLQSGQSPDHVLFMIAPIDGRFPSLEDGLSWPELLARYEVQGATDSFAFLQKLPGPRTYRLTPVTDAALRLNDPRRNTVTMNRGTESGQSFTFRLGETVAVPSMTDGPIWAQLEASRTPLGVLATILYKPPILLLRATLRDGRQVSYRLVPGMTRAGFVLSPLVPTTRAFAAFAGPDWQRQLSGMEVTQIQVVVGNESGSTACYQPMLRLTLYRLEISR